MALANIELKLGEQISLGPTDIAQLKLGDIYIRVHNTATEALSEQEIPKILFQKNSNGNLYIKVTHAGGDINGTIKNPINSQINLIPINRDTFFDLQINGFFNNIQENLIPIIKNIINPHFPNFQTAFKIECN